MPMRLIYGCSKKVDMMCWRSGPFLKYVNIGKRTNLHDSVSKRPHDATCISSIDISKYISATLHCASESVSKTIFHNMLVSRLQLPIPFKPKKKPHKPTSHTSHYHPPLWRLWQVFQPNWKLRILAKELVAWWSESSFFGPQKTETFNDGCKSWSHLEKQGEKIEAELDYDLKSQHVKTVKWNMSCKL